MQFIADVGRLVTSAATQVPLTHPLQVPLWIDLTAVVVGALAGAGVAVRERFDAVGVLLLAVVMGPANPAACPPGREAHTPASTGQ